VSAPLRPRGGSWLSPQLLHTALDTTRPRELAFQGVESLQRTTWPKLDVPMQLHVDYTVSSADELERQRERAEGLGR
jgi:hypothetical protein